MIEAITPMTRNGSTTSSRFSTVVRTAKSSSTIGACDRSSVSDHAVRAASNEQGQRGQDQEQRDAGVDDVPGELEQAGADASEPRRGTRRSGSCRRWAIRASSSVASPVATVRGRHVTRTAP